MNVREMTLRETIAIVVAVLLLMPWLGGCSRDADDEKSVAPVADAADSKFAGVTLDAEAQQRLGLEFASVASTAATAAAHGTAVVVDGAALAATQADLDSARTEAAAARENYDRLQALFKDGGNASGQAVNAARTQWAASRARQASAEARARSDWGAAFVAPQGAGAKWLDEITSGRALLLRAEFSGSLPGDVEQLQYSLLSADPNDTTSLRVEFVGRSRAPTQTSSGPSVILRTAVSAGKDLALRPGERLPVVASARSDSTRALVPAAAAFADGGQFWCYIARGEGRFDRVPLASIERIAEGYPIADGANVGDRVVVRGAPLLLSLERGSGSVAAESD
jgi:hypothetical protein